MNVLGVQWRAHDNAAAVVVDGRLVAAIEEERLSRKKYGRWILPRKAIAACLDLAGLAPRDVDVVALNWSPSYNFSDAMAGGLSRASPATVGLELAGRAWSLVARPVMRGLTSSRAKIAYVPHHLAHAASAFLQSRFEDCVVVVIDGYGDYDCASIFSAAGGDLTLVKKYDFPNSLGFIYGALTQYLGFYLTADEYKVMGLSSYGDRAAAPLFEGLVRESEDGWFALDPRYFSFARNFARFPYYSSALVEKLGPPRERDAPVEKRYADIAAALQVFCERQVLRLVRHAQEITGARRLCLAGGVAMNCVANGKVAAEGLFDEVYVGPSPHDAGGAVGAALYADRKAVRGRSDDATPFLGPGYADRAIGAALERSGLDRVRLEDAADAGARLIARGAVIAWFQGRMEFGPRALGARSILADPRDPGVVAFLNARIKQREDFRPFAPAVLLERAGELFDLAAPSPHMEFVSPVLPAARAVIPGVTHVDGSARVQTVTERANPLFYRLIASFAAQTGVPCVLNTSFNSHGEPIVCSPDDALACFAKTDLKRMIIGDWLVAKSAADLEIDRAGRETS